jgi:hypothetical protein
MTWPMLLVVYRVLRVKAGWYCAEWVAARNAGLVVG